MEFTLVTVLSCVIFGLFTIFWIFPLIGKTMKFLLKYNTEINEYKSNVLNGCAMVVFLLGLLFMFYCIGIVLSMVIAAV